MFSYSILCTILFFIGISGVILNRRHAIMLMINIEIILLSLMMQWLICSFYLDDFIGLAMGLFILTIAAAESSLGLAIIILFNRIRGNTSISENMLLKN
jgi:NADH-quinone oxidoreductase subunit K